MGDSITQCWTVSAPGVCPDPTGLPWPNGINAGIGGQTVDQMLARFQQDVILPRPAAVVIEAYSNDFFFENEDAQDVEVVVRQMVNMALDNNIRVVLTSTIPRADSGPGSPFAAYASDYDSWAQSVSELIPHVSYADYYDVLADPNNFPLPLPGVLTPGNGVHPSGLGLKLMTPVAQIAIQQVLGQ